MGMKVGNCIGQEGVVFGDDDFRRNGKLSYAPSKQELSLTVCAAHTVKKHKLITQRIMIC